MEKALRIIFIGTPDFAVESLKSVVESGRNVVAVITAPDRKAGRGQKIQESAVKQYAASQNLAVLQPTNLKDPSFIEKLKSYKADLQIVVAFRMLPEKVWNMPRLGTFNLHASLLPHYRGAAPINWVIINGEQKTAVTTFFLKHEIDTGDLLFQEEVEIAPRETAGSLHDKLMQIGGGLVVKSVKAIEEDNYTLKNQEELLSSEKVKHAPKIFKEDCRINWNDDVEAVDALIRGMSPYPTAWTMLEHKTTEKRLNLKVYLTALSNELPKLKAGAISVDKTTISVGCGNGSLEILELQVEGKKRMTAKELLNGFDLEEYRLI